MRNSPPPYNPNYPPPPPPPQNFGYPQQTQNYGGFSQQPDMNYPGAPPSHSGPGYGMPPPPPPVHGGYGVAPSGQSHTGDDVEWGAQPKSSQFGFDNSTIRQAFVRKVFTILTIQLTVVAGMIAIFVFSEKTKLFVRQNQWLYWLSYGTFLASYIAIVCCESVRRRFPGNLICLSVLTLAMGYMAAMISSFHKADVVFIAFAITVGCCAAITIFAMQTKYDFTGCMSVMVVLGFVLMFTGIAAIVLASIKTNWQWFYAVYCGLGAAFFMVWLAIDVQLVMGGKRMEISPEDYILAAVQLFLDIIYIFLYLLQLIGYLKRD